MDARTIIDALGKPRAIAEALGGIPSSTVAYWRHRNSIPARWWSPLADIARERRVRDVTVESIAQAHAVTTRPTQAAEVA